MRSLVRMPCPCTWIASGQSITLDVFKVGRSRRGRQKSRSPPMLKVFLVNRRHSEIYLRRPLPPISISHHVLKGWCTNLASLRANQECLKRGYSRTYCYEHLIAGSGMVEKAQYTQLRRRQIENWRDEFEVCEMKGTWPHPTELLSLLYCQHPLALCEIHGNMCLSSFLGAISFFC